MNKKEELIRLEKLLKKTVCVNTLSTIASGAIIIACGMVIKENYKAIYKINDILSFLEVVAENNF